MILNEKIKTLHNKIKENEAQYNWDRWTDTISALPSDTLNKYEYLTGEDLGYKPGESEPANVEHSPLCQIFTTWLGKNDKKFLT